MASSGDDPPASPWVQLPRPDWAVLRSATPLTLSEEDLEQLRGINERLSLDEVAEVYLPLSRLLNLYVAATQELHRATDTFLGSLAAKVPFVIGIAGSVAVGKSTTSRILQALLSRWPDHPEVALVTTDGFLWPNAVLEERGLMDRKGFPESYDVASLVRFVAQVKAGVPEVSAPVYSHLLYDIVPDEKVVIRQPDVLIVEGLNVLQTGRRPTNAACSSRTSSTSPCTWTPRSATSSGGTSSGSGRCEGPPSAIHGRSSTATPRSPTRKPTPPRSTSGSASTASTCGATSSRPGHART
jgi:pantothenate kinase